MLTLAAQDGSLVSQHQLVVFTFAMLGGITVVFLAVMVASVLIVLLRGGDQ